LQSGHTDFPFAFAPPHRLTVARPDSADKTLVDVWPDRIRLSWSFEDLGRFHPMIYALPLVAWEYDVTVWLGDQPVSATSWTRRAGWLPHAEVTFAQTGFVARLELVGGATAMIGRFRASGGGPDQTVRLSAVKRPAPPPQGADWSEAAVPSAVIARGHPGGYNVAWARPEATANLLVAGYGERADRIVMLGIGAHRFERRGPAELHMVWSLDDTTPSEGWMIRPYDALLSDVPDLVKTDWESEVLAAEREWLDILRPAMRPLIPDERVDRTFRACLADIFVMREPLPDGTIVTTPGTEAYRAPNTGEAAFAMIALDQVGLHDAAAAGFELPIANQSDAGDWADPTGWMHTMWCCSGFKSWAIMTHYLLTRDRDYLARVFPRMLASTRWQEAQRATTRAGDGKERPLTHGLMPRGMGDCGLREGDDIWGVFLPHNIWAVYADRLTAEAARVLDRGDDAIEADRHAERALADLAVCLDRGAIEDAAGYRWIPGSPGRVSGSRWGALNVAYPCRVLGSHDPLVNGTVTHVLRNMSPGGIPMNMGWMQDGMWVAIALDNLAEVLLERDEGAAGTALLHAVIDHATPFTTWCEERGPEPGTARTSGDRQHLYTPVSVVRYLRDALVMERSDAIHLGLGIDPTWLGPSLPVGVRGAPSAFGHVSYELRMAESGDRLEGWLDIEPWDAGAAVVLHIPLLRGRQVERIEAGDGGRADPTAATISWDSLRGRTDFWVEVGAAGQSIDGGRP
jgi:hypothetical protein